jgi:hypothetical protein
MTVVREVRKNDQNQKIPQAISPKQNSVAENLN